MSTVESNAAPAQCGRRNDMCRECEFEPHDCEDCSVLGLWAVKQCNQAKENKGA